MPCEESTTREPSGHDDEIELNMLGSYLSLNVLQASSYTEPRSDSENPLRYTKTTIDPL
jgi:hypothetical protein